MPDLKPANTDGKPSRFGLFPGSGCGFCGRSEVYTATYGADVRSVLYKPSQLGCVYGWGFGWETVPLAKCELVTITLRFLVNSQVDIRLDFWNIAFGDGRSYRSTLPHDPFPFDQIFSVQYWAGPELTCGGSPMPSSVDIRIET